MSKQHLVLDNGCYNIKAGLSNAEEPLRIQNTLTKTKDGHIHIGNDYLSHTNHYSGIIFRRPHDQGHLISWETEKPIWDYTIDRVSPNQEIDVNNTHLTLTETPFLLPQLSMNTDQIVFEEYGFNEYYRCIAPSLVPWVDENPNDFSLVIDSGYNATWIVPMIYQKVYWKGVKKLPIGGKLLNGLLREIISFRHYDIAEEPLLINTIKESTCFIAEDYNKTLKSRLKYKSEFVLPDFKTTTTGFVKTKDTPCPSDYQSLLLTDERFSVPESFYHPEILFDNMPTTNAIVQSAPVKSLTDLVVESIYACPEVARPLLLENLNIVGGTSKLANFTSRLEGELRKELPLDWKVKINKHALDAEITSWVGGANLANQDILNDVSVSKADYYEHGSNWCQTQFGFKNL